MRSTRYESKRAASYLALPTLVLLLGCASHLHGQKDLDGEAVFNSSCASCHGSEGAGGRGPSLRGQLRVGDHSSDIRNVILSGIPGTGMPKFDFDEEELRALVPYVRSLSRGPGSTAHPAGDAAEGKRIYNVRGCSGCHKIGVEGSAFGPNLTRIGSARSYEYLKTSIVNPSSDVPDDYQGITIVARDGKRYHGVRINEDSFTVQLRLPDQNIRSFNKQAIAQELVEKESPMPAYRFGEEELKNLLAYLSDLNGSSAPEGESKQERKLK